MSSFENDSIYNSSNDDDGDIVTNSRSRASKSSRLPPGLSNHPTISTGLTNHPTISTGLTNHPAIDSQISGGEMPLGCHMGGPGVVGTIPDLDMKNSQEPDDLEELGLNLGRRLARLEIGNKINTEKLEKIKERCKAKEKSRAMENVRVNDLEGKLISMEARLASEEKQGFEAKSKIESLEKTLKMKEKEILNLKEMLSKADAKRVKEEGRLSKLEEGNGQLTKQFLVLLETCETFNDELQSLKNMNIELRKELKKKEAAKVKSSEDIPSSAPVSESGGQASQNATKPQGFPTSQNATKPQGLATGVLNVKSDHQKETKASQNTYKKLSSSAGDKSTKPRKTVHPSGQNGLVYPSGYNVQEFVPRTPASFPSYYYSGPAGPGPYYYTAQPQLMVYTRPSANGAGNEACNGADFSGYQNHEYGQN